jgi:hypothetical protein
MRHSTSPLDHGGHASVTLEAYGSLADSTCSLVKKQRCDETLFSRPRLRIRLRGGGMEGSRKFLGRDRLTDAVCATQPDLFAFGPITRETFGKMGCAGIRASDDRRPFAPIETVAGGSRHIATGGPRPTTMSTMSTP